jgi:NADH-quinone oxidoreductase subunit L
MDSIWLVLAFPLLGALLCATHYRNLGKTATGALACVAILLSFAASAWQWFLVQRGEAFSSKLANWLVIPGVSGLDVAAQVDDLSAIMLCTVTGVAFLIHCYAMGYMSDEEDYGRFFASLNLFVATMVCLVMANNLGFLLVGWGGVGYASYSLIGFYRHKPAAVSAARKAFLINVVGDVGLMLALFLIASRTGAVDFKTFLQPEKLSLLGPEVMVAGGLLLIAAYAKSAQLPFHPWLPDAMEGPTPVSALIHAATMVTAGVYLVVRCGPLYSSPLASELMPMIAFFGALTALLAALCAIVQNDLKRILAYSTMSQLGYMFMAAGVGAYGAAIFHLVTHAFFKALLFLTAGVVIHAQHGEQDITRMGGLGKKMPGTQLAFLIGSLALAGIPPLAGFFSKEAILISAYHAPAADYPMMLWGVGIVTAFLTAYYTGRAYFLTFWAPARSEGELHHPGSSMTWPLAVLSVGTLAMGFTGGELMADVQAGAGSAHGSVSLQLVAIAVGALGLILAGSYHRQGLVTLVPASLEVVLRGCETIDGLYKALAGQFRKVADILATRVDPVFSQLAPDLVRRSMVSTSVLLCQLQGGSLRLYVIAILASTGLLALFVFGLVIFAPPGGPQ